LQLEDYLKAGNIAGEVRENVRKTDWIGSTLAEICDYVESEIIKRGAKCAFPVNTSMNEIAAHYTAEPNDPKTVSDTDLIKIDLGAQINGYIADTAVTVNYDPQYDQMVQTAEDALQNAMSMIKAGVKSKDVGRTIQKTIQDMGFKPIANLSGHSLDQYTIHAGKTVPNMFKKIKKPENAEKWILDALEKKKLIMGFGHRVYSKGDSRVPTMKKYYLKVAELLKEKNLLKISQIIEDIMLEKKNIHPNVDYTTGPTYHLMGFDTDFFTPIFVISRITGWSAHIMEQHATNKLIRPLSKYSGEKHRKVMLLNHR